MTLSDNCLRQSMSMPPFLGFLYTPIEEFVPPPTYASQVLHNRLGIFFHTINTSKLLVHDDCSLAILSKAGTLNQILRRC